MSNITFERVGKVYPGGTRAITDVSIEVDDGEFVVLVGPSGCGKSTLLRMVAGLEEVTEGLLRIGDKVVNDVSPKDRDIAMVFQNYALYPHMSVFDNMAFGLKMRRMPREEIRQKVREAASVLEISELMDRKPKSLSGGQRQRVAMGRAIVREPAAFLMDEPLSNLDAKLRVQMRAELGILHKRLQTTTLYVTHDQVEAMTMGDRVAVLRKASEDQTNLQQIDTPRVLYDHPANLFVAGFIGSPSMNFVYGRVKAQGGEVSLIFADEEVALSSSVLTEHSDLASYKDRQIVVGIRPEAFDIYSPASEADGRAMITADATLVEQLGSEAYVHFTKQAPPVITPDIRELLEDEGSDVASLGDTTKFVARVDPDLAPTGGDRIQLMLDISKLHFFDDETGIAIR
ncbi:MAG: sn-glycerol-3-phosphate ABC transporter ATP-binding protein UgpC [Actinomycetia bacterium]|nr:sn-glycerol-3-phosphate ABC transporter ATP-binding protein UgpC [Actinomycetes bacterium]